MFPTRPQPGSSWQVGEAFHSERVLDSGHVEVPVSLSASSRIIRFSTFEVNLHNGELRQRGQKVKLQEQPLQVLAALLERPGLRPSIELKAGSTIRGLAIGFLPVVLDYGREPRECKYTVKPTPFDEEVI